MTKWFSVWLLVALFGTSSCSSVHVAAVDFRDTSGSLKIISFSSIRAARDQVQFGLRNESPYDVYCTGASMRVVYDNPDTYLETGDEVLAFSGVFLREGGSLSASAGRGAAARRGTHIRSAVALEDGSKCREATFLDYCRSAEKSSEEIRFLAFLFERFRRATCEGLFERLRDEQRLNLHMAKSFTARPLVYLQMLREVDVDYVATAAAESEYLRLRSRSLFGVIVN